jgi:hypothetical protein
MMLLLCYLMDFKIATKQRERAKIGDCGFQIPSGNIRVPAKKDLTDS